MFTKYKQLILSAFVLICCLTDITHAKSRVKILDHEVSYASHCCDMQHHYEHLSRHALHKTTLAMHRAHQRALNACMCPQAYYQAQQHELLKHIAQLQAQCARNQEEAARTLQATQQALQLQQEKTAAIINQLTEQLTAMQQQYTELEQKYQRLEEQTPAKKSVKSQEESQDIQELESQPAQELTQLPEQSVQELQEQPQPDPVQQALLDEFSGKKRTAQKPQEPQESSTQAPVLESKEPHPELQLDDIDQETQQEPTQQSTQDKTEDQPQEIEAVVPETTVSGNSTIDENEEDAAFEQRLLDLLQEKQKIIDKLSQEKQALEHENTQLKQEIQNYQTALKEAHDTLFTADEQLVQEQNPGNQRALQQPVEQQELENYQTTLKEMYDLYDQSTTEKQTLEKNLKRAHEYIDQQKVQQQQAEQELRKVHKTLLKKSKQFESELQEKSTQLERATLAFTAANSDHGIAEKKYRALRQQVERPRVSQATQTQTQDLLLSQTKYVSLTSSPCTYTNGQHLDYTLTFTFNDKTIVIKTQDTQEQNRQAIQELIEILKAKEELINIQTCLQEALYSYSNPEECVMILINLFYRNRSSFSLVHPPHPIIATLTLSSLNDLADTKELMSDFHKNELSKMVKAACTALESIPEANIYSDSDNQEDTQENIQALEKQADTEQPQPENVQSAVPTQPQRSRLSRLINLFKVW